MNPPPDVALALAGAFLAGEWEPSRMTRRGREAMGGKRGWMVHLAHTVRHEYPEPPLDRPRELAHFIAACPSYRRAEIRRRERETADLSKTMAALDGRLKTAERWSQLFERYTKPGPSKRSPAEPNSTAA